MANRYAVATGNWNDNNTWSATDGGAPGASYPTSTDDAFLTALSGAITVTWNLLASNQCRNFDCTGFTGTWALTQSGSIFGGLTLSVAMTVGTTGNVFFDGNLGGTITTNGQNLTTNFGFRIPVTSSATWTLGDNLQIGGFSIESATSTLNTNGKSLTLPSFGGSAGQTVGTLTLGSSTLTCTTAFNTSGTVNAGTSSIVLTAGGTFDGNGQTYNNVTFTLPASSANMTGVNTFNNLTINGAASQLSIETFAANQTVTNLLTVTGNSSLNRISIRSSVDGTVRTISAGSVSLTNVDFMDITALGAAIPWTGTILGDYGGNTNITFTTAANQFWVADTGNWSDAANHWASTTGGTAGTGRVPLPQDTAKFDANSFTGASKTVTVNVSRISSIDCTGVTNTPTLNFSTACDVAGSVILATVIISGTAVITFKGSNANTITSAGITWTNPLTFKKGSGSITILDNLTTSGTGSRGASAFQIQNGFFYANNFNVTCKNVLIAAPATVSMGSGNWTVNSTGTIWNSGGLATFLSPNNSTIIISDTSATTKTFIGGSDTYNNISITGGGTGSVTITGSNTFNVFTINAPKTVIFSSGTTQTVQSFIATGSVGNVITITSDMAGTQATLSKASGTVICDYLSLKDSNATGGAIWYAGINSTNVSNNSGWIFTSAATAIKGINTITGIQSITF